MTLGIHTPTPVKILVTEWQKENEISDIQAHFKIINLNSETFKEEIWTKLLK